jgi:hypothetical protein
MIVKLTTSGLFELLSDLLTNEEVDSSEGVQYSQTMETMLRCYPKDLAPEFGDEILVEFYRKYFSTKRKGSADRVNLNILRSLYRFASNNASNMAESILTLSEQIVPRLCLIWRETNQDLVKIALIQFLRVMMRLYQIENRDSPFLSDLHAEIRDSLNSSRLFNQHTKK